MTIIVTTTIIIEKINDIREKIKASHLYVW